MNLTEKRKLEDLVVSKVDRARNVHLSRERDALERMKEELETKPPKAVAELLASLKAEYTRADKERKTVNDDYKEARKKLEKELEALTTDYDKACATLTKAHETATDGIRSAIGKHGFNASRSYDNEVALTATTKSDYSRAQTFYTYNEPTLRKGSERLISLYDKYADMRDSYTVSIYSESDEAEKIVAKLLAELKAVSA